MDRRKSFPREAAVMIVIVQAMHTNITSSLHHHIQLLYGFTEDTTLSFFMRGSEDDDARSSHAPTSLPTIILMLS